MLVHGNVSLKVGTFVYLSELDRSLPYRVYLKLQFSCFFLGNNESRLQRQFCGSFQVLCNCTAKLKYHKYLSSVEFI